MFVISLGQIPFSNGQTLDYNPCHSFYAIAVEIKLKGLTGQTPNELLLEEEEKPGHSEPAMMGKDLFATSSNGKKESTTPNALGKLSRELVAEDQSGTDLQALDEKVKSMMEKGQKMIPNNGKRADGTPMHQRVSICKVCGKEGLWKVIRDHIEYNHLGGLLIPCVYCDKTFSSRNSLGRHKRKHCVTTLQ